MKHTTHSQAVLLFLCAVVGTAAHAQVVDTVNTLVNQLVEPVGNNLAPTSEPITDGVQPMVNALGLGFTTPMVDALQEPLEPMVQAVDQDFVAPFSQALAPIADPILQQGLDPILNLSNELAAVQGSDTSGLLDGIYAPLTSGGLTHENGLNSGGLSQLNAGAAGTSVSDLNVFAAASRALWGESNNSGESVGPNALAGDNFFSLTAQGQSGALNAEGGAVEVSVSDANPNVNTSQTLNQVGQTLVLRKVNFETNEAILTATARDLLDRVASVIRQLPPNFQYLIGGHTDSVGAASYNQRLSQSRAQAVVDYLETKGVKVGQLKAIGFGQAKPMTTNATQEGRAQNRRVEITRTL